MTEKDRADFDRQLFAVQPGREVSPEIAERLRESEMAAFRALQRQNN